MICPRCHKTMEIILASCVCLTCDGVECVFVGGGSDGARVRVHDPFPATALKMPQEGFIGCGIEDYVPLEWYYPIWIHDNARNYVFVFYRHQDLTEAEAITRLITGYKDAIP